MPLADDFSAPTNNIKPPPKPKATKPKPVIYGPTAPTVGPTRASAPRTPKQGPRVQSPAPSYTSTIFDPPKRANLPKTNTSSSDLSSFIQGLKQTNKEDIIQSATGTIVTGGTDSPTNATIADEDLFDQYGRQNHLIDFLKKIRPDNYDPNYGGPVMPEAWKHKGNDINKPLKPHWDAKAIAENLSDFDEGSSFQRFAMNDIIKKQLRNQQNWVKEQTLERAYHVKDFLEKAGDDAFDGDFSTLSEKLKKNPDFLEFAKYKDDYTTSPEEVMTRWAKEKGIYTDEWVKNAMRLRTDSYRKHYEYTRQFYNDARTVANRAIKKYEKTYNRSVEFDENAGGKKAALAKAAGPAIPEAKNEDKSFLDAVGAANPESKGSARFLSDREQAKRKLGVDKLPTVKEMLTALVAQGSVDPNNDGEVRAWINRLQNPNHPDTRAMYVAFARNVNKKLDVKGEAMDWINEPIDSYITTERRKAAEQAEKDRLAQEKGRDLGTKAGIGYVLDTIKEPWNMFDTKDSAERLSDNLIEASDDNLTKSEQSAGAMFWTFDKLSRASYAVAGATNAWYDADKSKSTDPEPWWKGTGVFMRNDPLSWFTGKEFTDTLDEWTADPASVGKQVGDASYQQFFRGSDLPNIKKDTVPITFSQVIARNAMWDSEDNMYDKKWYQHVSGFALDVGMDPLNFVGVGAVSTVLKVPVRTSKSVMRAGELSRNAVSPSRLVREINAPHMSPAAERTYRIQQLFERHGDMVQGDALVSERSITPYQFTVEYTDNAAPVGNAGTVPEYTNARWFAETKPEAAQIRAELAQLQVEAKNYPSHVALESHKKEMQKLVDDLDLGGTVTIPELRVRTLMEQNSIPIRTEGVTNLKISNPGGEFWRRVLNPLEDATAKWPGHKSSTKFAEFTDEAGNTRLTTRAEAAQRALKEQDDTYALGNVGTPEQHARWNKAIDEAESVDPNTGKPHMWQEYDVEHYLDEGAPGLISGETGWTPLKAYAKGSGLSPERFAEVTGWTNEEIIRSLHRGPKLLRDVNPDYAARMDDAAGRVSYSKNKLATTQEPSARAAAYRALEMAYRDMSQATLEGSFHYLDAVRKGSKKFIGGDNLSAIKAEQLDVSIKALDDIDIKYSPTDDLGDYYGKFGKDSKGDLTFDSGYDKWGQKSGNPYREINLDEFNSVEDALNSVDASEFSNKSAQIDALRNELQAQRESLDTSMTRMEGVLDLSEQKILDLDQMLPVQSQFRKGSGFDREAIAKHLSFNKEDIAGEKSSTFKVSWKLPKPEGDDPVKLARWQREARFLDSIAKAVEEKANVLFRKGKTEIVKNKKVNTPVSEPLQRLEDEIQDFWQTQRVGPKGTKTKKLPPGVKTQKMGPAERRVGPKPTRESVRSEFPNTVKQELDRSRESRNASRNVETLEVDKTITGKPKPNRIAPWDASQGMAKTAADRRIDAVLRGKQRRWEKERKAAQETDAARYKELTDELAKLKGGSTPHKLTVAETQKLYNDSFADAKAKVFDKIEDTKTLNASGANTRLAIGDAAKAMHKQAADRIKFEELKLKIEKAEAQTADEIIAVEAKRKALIKKKIALYDRVKKAKMEANTVRITMQHRLGEEHIIQGLMMPERMEAKVLQLHIFGMRKNLQFTSSLFKGAELAEKMLPASVWSKYVDNWVRPSKQLRTAEGVTMRAEWESKTPVVLYSRLKKLNAAMANTTDSERSGMLLAYRRGVPYGGPKQLENFKTIEALEEIMDIINGNHHGFMFKPLGKHIAEPLTLDEILRFLPEEYSFNKNILLRGGQNRLPLHKNKNAGFENYTPGTKPTLKHSEAEQEAWIDLKDVVRSNPDAYPFNATQAEMLYEWGADLNKVEALQSSEETGAYISQLKKDNGESFGSPVGTPDPFSPAPEPRFNFSFDDLMVAVESNGKATPKDLIDPYRVAWVYHLAAGQAAQLRAIKKMAGETFGVVRPSTPEKMQLWQKLETQHGWESVEDIPGVLFPKEIVHEVKTLMKFTQPGPEQQKFIKMMDQALGYWKQGMTIYNPAYYARNGIGEAMVSWLDGVSNPKYYRAAHRIQKYLKKSDQDLADLVTKYDVLEGKIPVDVVKGNEVVITLKGGFKVRIEDILREYVNNGLKTTFVNTDIGKGVRGLANESLEANSIRRGLKKTNTKIHEKGEGFEDYFRLAHFIHAMENSGKGSLKEAAAYAATRVRRSHFDYTDFSDAEKAVMLRAFPFYKWIRRGAPLMMQHVFMTPGKMLVAPKAMDMLSGLGVDPINVFNEGPVFDTQDVYEDKNGYLPNYSGIAPAWIRDLFAYQMQPAADDEYANFFRVSLPQYDGLQGILSILEGDIMDSPVNTLMNPFIKAPLELGMNKSLDPDNNFPIVGGEYNENMGISDGEAVGVYLARQANPWSSFLAKLSKNGKLPDGLNISDVETGRDATRDVASFFSGMGFYQSKLGYNGEVPESPSAVGRYESISEVPQLSGRAAPTIDSSEKNEQALKKLMDMTTNTTGDQDSKDSAKGWIDYKNKKSGWIPNKYGKKSRRYSGSGGFGGGSDGVDWAAIFALLETLKKSNDAGRVIDPNVFQNSQDLEW